MRWNSSARSGGDEQEAMGSAGDCMWKKCLGSNTRVATAGWKIHSQLDILSCYLF
jgi:hypothetical protein